MQLGKIQNDKNFTQYSKSTTRHELIRIYQLIFLKQLFSISYLFIPFFGYKILVLTSAGFSVG